MRLFSRAKHANRALIFLTDGESSVSTQEVIREARRLGVVVYCISIGLPVPSSLDSIARASGGRSFSNIASLDAAVRLYQELSMLIRQNSPCVIEWISDAACRREERVRMLSSSALPPNITATARYMPPQAISEQIPVNPTTLPFGAVQTGSITQRTMSISLASGAQNRTVLRWISPDSTTLRVLMPTPLTLQAGATPLTVDISYRLPGSGYRFFTILAELDNGCTLPLYITTGAFGERPIIPTLELVRPNGRLTTVGIQGNEILSGFVKGSGIRMVGKINGCCKSKRDNNKICPRVCKLSERGRCALASRKSLSHVALIAVGNAERVPSLRTSMAVATA